mgnify:CR=1 FL=1
MGLEKITKVILSQKIKKVNRKKEGIKPSSVTTNSPLHTTEEGLHSQRYKDFEDIDIIKDFVVSVKQVIVLLLLRFFVLLS